MLCSWARHLTLTVPLSTQVYKSVPANLMLEVPLRWTGIHPGGSRNTPSRFMPQTPEINTSLMGHLARMQTLPYHMWRYVENLITLNFSLVHFMFCLWTILEGNICFKPKYRCKTHTSMSEVWMTRTFLCGCKTNLIRLHVHKHKGHTHAILKRQ